MDGLKKSTTPPRVSFGVELEFFVAFILEGERDPDADIKDQLQPLITVPLDWERTAEQSPKSGVSGRIHKPKTAHVYGQIERALADAGLPVMGDREQYGKLGSAQAIHGEQAMSSFRLVEDVSLKADHVDGYRWERVELISPAMYDMELSYDMLRVAVSTVTTNFRCRVNPSCGFHVHVGAGPTQRIDARTLRQFAALLWAADPVISRLHPPWRSATTYSQSARVNEITDLGKCHNSASVMLDGIQRGINPQHQDGKNPSGFKMTKFLGRDRRLGESVEVDMSPEVISLEIELDQEDDMALLETEPWQHQQDVPVAEGTRPNEGDASEEFGFPPFTYEAPGPMPRNYRNPRTDIYAPPRPRPPPIPRRYGRFPGTMRKDIREDPNFLDGYLMSSGGNVEVHGRRVPPLRSDVMSGVRDLLGADLTVAQVGELMRNKLFPKNINYKFDAYSLRSVNAQDPKRKADPREWTTDWSDPKSNTIEFREAAGSLDMEWIATWARICCRLLEWSRDAAPAEFLCVIRLLAWAQEEEGAQYDIIDFLIDLGLLKEARFCEERLEKGEAAWWECLNLGRPEGSSEAWQSLPEMGEDFNLPWYGDAGHGRIAEPRGVAGHGTAVGDVWGGNEGEYQFGESEDDDEDEELQPPYDMKKLQEPVELDSQGPVELDAQSLPREGITLDGAVASGDGDSRAEQAFVGDGDADSNSELEPGYSWVGKAFSEKEAVTDEDGFEIVDDEE
ncbi:uncharacterized protein LY79DRAFT_527144 [Colletotrichum navitas]|uniref:Amidoligase enzyme n=1 Tax=Colletotrichum navitas TaxID=681940 RepID=A0AAD8UYM7_9PEZI|nr:uncharacterized protein LY79DRAFT_527144 [Colletotrichum navitas]KAK1570286.1 hypothetical protein LY79DRAFT_527144 [Colletotrichum navitas]